MRYVLVVLALLAGAAVFLLLRERGHERVVRRDEVTQEEARGARGRAAPAGDEAAAAGNAVRRADAPGDPEQRPAPKCRLVYADGAPAAGVALRLAVGRPLYTKIFRNGDYPEKVVWLVTHQELVRTGPDGGFTAPRGGRIVAYTDPDSPAYVLAEIDPHQGDVRADRRAPLRGVLRQPDGKPWGRTWVAAQMTRPEDWQTRNSKEKDTFAHATGELDIDPGAKIEMLTDAQGRFELAVVPGRQWLVFGEHGELGTREIVVSTRGADLGDVVVSPTTPPPDADRALHGFVLDCAGRPRPGAHVWLWDGVVGEPSHKVVADDDGRFECTGLKSEHVIAWALSTVGERHLILPGQSSGTIRLPCRTPVTLTAPSPNEYQWVASRPGYHLFLRDGVFIGAAHLGAVDRIGLPPGSYHIVALILGGRILETDHVVAEGGHVRLLEFRDTTQG